MGVTGPAAFQQGVRKHRPAAARNARRRRAATSVVTVAANILSALFTLQSSQFFMVNAVQDTLQQGGRVRTIKRKRAHVRDFHPQLGSDYFRRSY
jgi:hypothetical protein